jgi:sugar/nucleoside kinase (ribokinase family)
VSTYLAVGSVCWDVVEGEDARRLGGSVLFASRVALAAGWDAHIVTSGTDELAAALRAALPDVRITVQPSPTDTLMWFSSQADLGPQRVPSVADPVRAELVVEHLGAEVVHLAPILGEVTPELVAAARAAAFVGITPQGLLRHLDPADARLLRRPALDPWWAPQVDAVVLSEDEHALVADPGTLGHLPLAITRGERGCLGRWGDQEVDVAGVALDHVDPAGTIGAGDVLAAAYFVALAEGAAFGDALRRANQTAAAHVGRR